MQGKSAGIIGSEIRIIGNWLFLKGATKLPRDACAHRRIDKRVS
jgi:hypothetical protein